MPLFAAALPILPSKTERFRRFGVELEQHKDEYEELNARYHLRRQVHFVQPGEQGDLGIVLFGADSAEDLAAMGSREWTDSDYDNWYVGFIEDVHGFRLREMAPGSGPFSEVVFNWQR